MKKRTIATVNVLEWYNDSPNELMAFPDTAEGNKAAEKMFTKIGMEHGMAEEETPVCIENGYFGPPSSIQSLSGAYQLFIVHSAR